MLYARGEPASSPGGKISRWAVSTPGLRDLYLWEEDVAEANVSTDGTLPGSATRSRP
jgi:hypothetical protein